MAHSVSARKRIRQANKRRIHNASIKSNFRTAMKKVLAAVEAGDREAATAAYRAAVPVIDKVSAKGLIHKNKAARHKSRLNKAIQSIA
ncbi:MAG: 30S ribosomal protein S20 [Pseudomonadota bacterium]